MRSVQVLGNERLMLKVAGVLAVCMLGCIASINAGSSRTELVQKLSPAAARQMSLWGWNMQYKHHEHKPIYFGAHKNTGSARQTGLVEVPEEEAAPATPQQLWMYNLGYEHHEHKPIFFGAHKNTGFARQTGLVEVPSEEVTREAAPATPQQLWMYNLGYEHHEHKPIFFGAHKNTGSARQTGLVEMPSEEVTREAAPATPQQLWMYNLGYEHHEQTPFQMFPVRAA